MTRSRTHLPRCAGRAWLAAVLAAAATVATLSVAAGPASAAPHVVVVGPGEVQAALNAAAPGTTVKLEPGTYSEQMTISTDNITLEGSGRGQGGTLLTWPPAQPAGGCIVCIAGNGDRVTDLKVDLSTSPFNPNVFGPNTGIATTGSPSGPAVDDVTVVGNGGSALTGVVLVGTNGSVRDTQTSGLFTGVVVSLVGGTVNDSTSRANCIDIFVIDLGFLGFGPLGQASNVTVEGNRLRGPETCFGALTTYSGGGIVVFGSPHSTVRDNVISGINDPAIETDAPYDTITGNTVVNSCLGIDVRNDTYPGGADHAVVRDNEVLGTGASSCYPTGVVAAAGIRLDGATNSIATGNEVHMSLPAPPTGATVDGLLVTTSFFNPAALPQNITVAGNEVHDTLNGFSGFDVAWDGTGGGVVFHNNECRTSSPAGLCAAS